MGAFALFLGCQYCRRSYSIQLGLVSLYQGGLNEKDRTESLYYCFCFNSQRILIICLMILNNIKTRACSYFYQVHCQLSSITFSIENLKLKT